MNPTIRILYAEDNPQDADLTLSHFAEHAPDFAVEIVGTGRGCLDRLPKADYDLLLLDHHLPDMDGLDMLQTILQAGVQTPVVLVTGVGCEDLVVKALRLGAVNYVPKLGNYLDTLHDLLRGVVEEHRRKESQGLLASASRRLLYLEHQLVDIELTLRHFATAAPHFVVDVVHTCAEAQTRLQQAHPYDLVLIDLRMPDQNGLDFVREARRLCLPLPPFIMISGQGDDAAAIAALKLGAADYIAKREGYLDQLTHVTDHVITHDKLRRLNEHLQTELAERKGAEEERLALQRQLLHSQNLESLGVLAGGIAHDFNNLLQIVLGNLEFARGGLAPGASARPYLEDAVRAANRAADLTRQILAYAGKGQFVVEEVNLNDLVAENASMLRTAIPRTVDLQIHRELELPPILADAAQMQQVLMNLLTNASEAIGEVPGDVTLQTGVMVCSEDYLRGSRLEEKPAPGQFAWLEVTDNGCGMDAETQQRLFEPFYTTKFTGRGLGLSAVMGIVRGHHGALMLKSELGAGTAVRVLFPVTLHEGASVTEVQASASGGVASSASGLGTVLVVDDEPAVLAFCARAIRSQGLGVLTAQDGEEAVKLFRAHSETIVCTLLDYTMPKMSGLSSFQELRRIKPDAKVILCSGYGEEKATESFAGQGLAGFLQKPYSLDAMWAALKEVLEGKATH